jgi:uncharacterized surface protein with fasciclin (FAS1) repeats
LLSDDNLAADVACSSDEFSTICSLVQTAGLATALGEGGPLTIFLPNNDAFTNLGQDLVDLLTAEENRITLEEVLLNHVVTSESVVLAADLECDGTVPMLSGETTTTICVAGDIFQIGQGNIALNQDEDLLPQIVATDTDACNGVVHEVSNVILPQSVADLVDGVDGDDNDEDNPDVVEPACSPNLGKKDTIHSAETARLLPESRPVLICVLLLML